MLFTLSNSCNDEQLSGELADHYLIKKEPSVFENIVFYDTFDWRLYNQSLVLYESGNRLFLRKLFENEIIYSSEISSPPVFIRYFPDSDLKERLAPVIKMRALFKLAEVYLWSRTYRILNPDEKTVARLVCEEIRPSRTEGAPVFAAYLLLKPVKGYRKHSRSIARRFEEKGLKESHEKDIYFKALGLADKKPGSYSSKLNMQLDPDTPSDEAARIILRFLLQVIRINEANIEKDLDTEFLHDFRVAIRRTRSALGQIKYVFPAETTERFKKDFAFAGKISNRLRDLDVFLLKEGVYRAKLSDVLTDDIDHLFDYLRRKRSKALKETIKGLKSKDYKQLLQDWEAFLNEPGQDSQTAVNAAFPVIDLARKIIYKKYRNSVKTGKMILENAPDEMLHVLRIECKKLRYLMEFFSSLFHAKKIGKLIDQLKKLQDNLGDFNDLRLQQKYLMNIFEELPATGKKSKKMLLAIGSMIEMLDREKQVAKDATAVTFTDYLTPENKRLFRELFVSEQKEVVYGDDGDIQQ